jgi:hypothetical protein
MPNKSKVSSYVNVVLGSEFAPLIVDTGLLDLSVGQAFRPNRLVVDRGHCEPANHPFQQPPSRQKTCP